MVLRVRQPRSRTSATSSLRMRPPILRASSPSV
nr:MAG TPA: hypothetical protein [Caudoviricetes sp.]